MVQEHPRLPPPHGGIARRRGHPDLQCAHRRVDVATPHRQTPRQAGHGTHSVLPHRLRGTRRSHHAVSASKNRSLIHPGGTAANEVAGDRPARIPNAGRGLGCLTPRNYRRSEDTRAVLLPPVLAAASMPNSSGIMFKISVPYGISVFTIFPQRGPEQITRRGASVRIHVARIQGQLVTPMRSPSVWDHVSSTVRQ